MTLDEALVVLKRFGYDVNPRFGTTFWVRGWFAVIRLIDESMLSKREKIRKAGGMRFDTINPTYCFVSMKAVMTFLAELRSEGFTFKRADDGVLEIFSGARFLREPKLVAYVYHTREEVAMLESDKLVELAQSLISAQEMEPDERSGFDTETSILESKVTTPAQGMALINSLGNYKVTYLPSNVYALEGELSYIDFKRTPDGDYPLILKAMGLDNIGYLPLSWVAVSLKELMKMCERIEGDEFTQKGNKIITKSTFFHRDVAVIHALKHGSVTMGYDQFVDFAERLRQSLNIDGDDFNGSLAIGSIFEASRFKGDSNADTIKKVTSFLRGIGYDAGMGGLSAYITNCDLPFMLINSKISSDAIHKIWPAVTQGKNVSHSLYVFSGPAEADRAVKAISELDGIFLKYSHNTYLIYEKGADNRNRKIGTIHHRPKAKVRHLFYETDYINLAERIASNMDPEDVAGVQYTAEILESKVPSFAEWSLNR